MEPMDDPRLKQILREWNVEDAPRSLDERVLGIRPHWWKALLAGSVRIPAPLALAFSLIFVVMAAALVRPRPTPPASAVSSEINLANFQPVQDLQIRIIKGGHVDQ